MKVVFSAEIQSKLVSLADSVFKGNSLGSKSQDRAAVAFSLIYSSGLSIDKVKELCGISEATVYRRVKAFTDDVLLPDGRDLKKKAEKST